MQPYVFAIIGGLTIAIAAVSVAVPAVFASLLWHRHHPREAWQIAVVLGLIVGVPAGFYLGYDLAWTWAGGDGGKPNRGPLIVILAIFGAMLGGLSTLGILTRQIQAMRRAHNEPALRRAYLTATAVAAIAAAAGAVAGALI